MRNVSYKLGALAVAALLIVLAAPSEKVHASFQTFSFPMVVSAGAATCVPHAKGHVRIIPGEQADTMQVQVQGLPKKTHFDFFIIQVPTAPFGLSWYQGDIVTNEEGRGNATFGGRFNIETFIVAPGAAPAPTTFPEGPFPDANMNPATNPVQLYHLGLWFSSAKAAQRAGCSNSVTPFNGEHQAGIQVLNTNNFPQLAGPLVNVH